VPSHTAVLLKIVGAPPVLPVLGTNYLSDLPAVYAYTGYGTIVKDKSIGGNTITLNSVTYPKGIGVNSRAGSDYDLGGICSRFQATIGVDDEEGSSGSVIFQVFADGTEIYSSGVMTGGAPSQKVDLDVTGVRRLILGVGDADDGINFDHGDWANALVIVSNTTPALPAAPTGLTASPGNPIALTWSANRSAASYNLKRATNSGGPYTNLIVSVPVPVYSDTNVTLGKTYYYVVSSVDSIGESTNSPEAGVTVCSPPATPGNVTASVTTAVAGQHVTVNWSAASGATSYTVLRGSPGTPYSSIATGVSGTQYTDNTPPIAATNYYVVVAANACSQGGMSTFAAGITPPASPTGLAATPGSTQAILNWNAATGATGYNVKRSTTSGSGYAIVGGGSNITTASFSDIGLVNGTTYYYVVSSLNGGGEGTNSPQVSVVPVTPPGSAFWTNTITSAAQSWNVNGNWTNVAAFPNGLNQPVVINPVLAASQTVNLNQAVTVGTLSIGAANGGGSCTIAPNGGSLIFNNGGIATLTQIANSKGDTITAPVTIASSLSIANASANPFTLAGTISGTTPTLVISGPVTVGDGTVNGSLGTVAFVTNNGSLTFARSDGITFSGVISGSGSVVQNGSGSLTLGASNTFSGGVSILHSILQTTNGGALGSTAGTTVIASGATLDVDGQNLGAEPIIASGTGSVGIGAIYNSGAQQTHAIQSLTLAGDTSIGGAGPWNPVNNVGRWDLRNGTLSTLGTTGHPYKLTKVGNNQISIVGITVDSALGDIDITGGLMGWETSTTSMGNPASNLFVRAGATLSFYNASTAWNKVFKLYGDGVTATVTNWSGSNVMVGPVTLNGSCVFAIASTAVTLTGPVGGSGGLIKNLASPLYLYGVDNYTGATGVNAGKLAVVSPGSITATTNITVMPGAVLDVSGLGSGGMTLAAGQTLGGFGSVNGNFSVGSGATLAPGNAIGTMTFSNALTLAAGGTNILAVSMSPTTNAHIVVLGSLAYGGTLVVTNLSATPLAAGDAFALFSAASYIGTFGAILPAKPGPTLAWDASGLTNGILRVIAVPPPHIGSMTMNNGKMIFSGNGGLAGAQYYLLASTNLTLTVPQWTSIATNYFDTSGNFTITNPVFPSAPRTFYLLQVP
jgi:autotransporter-associated beta strand protein